MVLMNALADALKSINTPIAEKWGKRQVLIRPSPCSKVNVKFTTVMMKHGKSII